MSRVFPSLFDILIKNFPNRQNSVTAVTEFSKRMNLLPLPKNVSPMQNDLWMDELHCNWEYEKYTRYISIWNIIKEKIESLKNIDVSCFFHRHLPVLTLIKSKRGLRYWDTQMDEIFPSTKYENWPTLVNSAREEITYFLPYAPRLLSPNCGAYSNK